MKRAFHYWSAVFRGGYLVVVLVVFCGRKRRVVSTARTRTMAAHGVPVCPAIVTAADAFSNDTDKRDC